MNRRTLFLLFILFAVAAIVGPGCVGKSSNAYRLDEEIRRPGTNELVYSRHVRHGVTTEAPENAAGPTTSTVGELGGSTSVAGTHDKPLAAYGIEQRQVIFYGGGAALVIGAAVSFWLGQRMLAACLAAAAGVLFVAPTFVDLAAPYIAAAVGLLVIVGGIWLVASLYRSHRENLSGVASALKLGTEGAAREAVAALRETPIARTVKKGKS